MKTVLILSLVASTAALAQAPPEPAHPLAHFHHVHLNATDPAAAIRFYTSKFKARRESFAGFGDAVWTGDSWLLFAKVDSPPPSELLSGIWHIGWGAEDMQSAYQQQLARARASLRRSPISATWSGAIARSSTRTSTGPTTS